MGSRLPACSGSCRLWSAIEGVFDCSGLGLKTLAGAPAYVRDDLLCMNNCLTTLGPDPMRVGGDVHAQGNPLDFSQPAFAEGSSVGRVFCSPTRFSGPHHDMQQVTDKRGPWFSSAAIQEGILMEYHHHLPLLLLCGIDEAERGELRRVRLFNCPKPVAAIIEPQIAAAHLGRNKAAMAMQRHLLNAGYEENAKC